MSVYDFCPVLTGEHFRLVYTELSHCDDLLKVYSDENSVPLFNSDNCGGDDFHYKTYDRMKEAIEYWQWEYSRKGFVRMSVIDINTDEAVGTVEMFKRTSDDYFTDTVLLRLDLRSDYENREIIADILSIVINNCFDLFSCKSVTTKAVSSAFERINALNYMGFIKSDKFLIGHNGTKYSDYFIKLLN